jgi:Uma2 family endonuclease
VIVEVLSRKTRRIDEGEKRDAYVTIPSLTAYLLVEQEFPGVTLHRRTEQGFVQETHAELDAVIPLPEIGVELPLAEMYDGVEFAPEPDDDN